MTASSNKEKMLVLAKTYLQPSKRYEYLACIAGITDDGEWRRLYPVPWDVFWKGGGRKFSKKQWIEYELKDNKPPKTDYRKESRKVRPETIRPISAEYEDYSKIEEILTERTTTVEDLRKESPKDVSLGAIKPIEVTDFVATPDPYYEKKLGKLPKGQETLSGDRIHQIYVPPYKFQYVFKCSPSCEKGHKIMIEDWEVEEARRKWKDVYKSEEELLEKMKERYMSEVNKSKRRFFIMGNHFTHPDKYLIIGLIRPRKIDGY